MRILLFIACVCAATPTGVEVSEGCTSDNVDLLQSAKHSSLTGSTWHTIAAAVSTMRNDPSAKRARHSPEMEGLEASMSQLAGNVISGREEMTKGIKDIADAVRAEMSKIVAEVENGEKQALQDQINAGVAAFDECAAPATIDDNFETAANSKETAHSDCRTEEKTLKGVAANKANTYDDEFPASPPSCNSNFAATYATPATMEQISTFTECVQKTADWWSAYKSSAIPAANAYKAAAIAHTDETAKCNTAQTTFETTYCSYAVHFEDTCGAYTRCYTAKSSAFQNMTKDVQTLEATHKRLFTSAKHITCLLNLLEDTSNTDKQTLLNDCLNEQIDTSSVEVTMKSAPEAADCHSVAGTVENPGGQGFATKFYNQKDWHDDAPTQAQIECVIPVSDSSQATGPPAKLDVSQWSVAGIGAWYGNCRKDSGGSGYCFHAENLIKGWTNGGYGSSWLGPDSERTEKLWFCYDLGARYHINSISLKPQGNSNSYQSSEYELLLSNSPPAASSGDFAAASSGFQQVVHEIPGSDTNKLFTHQLDNTARYVMFHAMQKQGHSGGVNDFEVVAQQVSEAAEAPTDATTQEPCTKWLDVGGSDNTITSFWQTQCQNLPSSASFLKLKMGEVVDYFKPTSGNDLCAMLITINKHEWSKDGITWRVPNYYGDSRNIGGSQKGWPRDNVDGDSRLYLPFWGGTGCCHNTYNDGAGWNKAFTMSYCSA